MSVPERLAERLRQETPLLRQAFPNATLDCEALVVILHDHLLPAGWSHDHTDVLFAIPLNYPAGQPDNICARPDLTLAGEMTPGNSQGIQQHAGGPWLQFSYHIDPNDWHPHADPVKGSNLADYLVGALTRFQEAS
ncbi:E2/UBC family protein [Streptomyces sp. HPF1205]|uniref:E2/UBC family protein n=1 Tax=Streptomyces sp. HPF1205 TaxID=2873262 RepID=UPI001CECFA3E|nr:E2/UBC family protein [Streptomyces sp. HPF1205]